MQIYRNNNVKFRDKTPRDSAVLGRSQTSSVAVYDNMSLSDYIGRPIMIPGRLTTGDINRVTYYPAGQFATAFSDVLSNFSTIRFGMDIHIIVRTHRLNFGFAIAAWIPYDIWENWHGELSQITNFPHIRMDLSANRHYHMYVPFISTYDYMTVAEMSRYGSLRIVFYGQNTVATDEAVMIVYANMADVHFGVPTVKDPPTNVTRASSLRATTVFRDMPRAPVSTAFHSSALLASRVHSNERYVVPYPYSNEVPVDYMSMEEYIRIKYVGTPVAQSASMFTTALSFAKDIANTVISDVTSFKPVGQRMGLGDASAPLTCLNGRHIDTSISCNQNMGNPVLDCTQRMWQKQLITVIPWKTSDARSKILTTIPVSPTIALYKRECAVSTPLRWIGMLHRYWKGSLNFHFRFIGNMFQSGQLVIIWNAINSVLVSDDAPYHFKDFVDFTHASEFTLNVPLRSVTRVLAVGSHNGILSVQVDVPLVYPNQFTVVGEDAWIELSISPGDDFAYIAPNNIRTVIPKPTPTEWNTIPPATRAITHVERNVRKLPLDDIDRYNGTVWNHVIEHAGLRYRLTLEPCFPRYFRIPFCCRVSRVKQIGERSTLEMDVPYVLGVDDVEELVILLPNSADLIYIFDVKNLSIKNFWDKTEVVDTAKLTVPAKVKTDLAKVPGDLRSVIHESFTISEVGTLFGKYLVIRGFSRNMVLYSNANVTGEVIFDEELTIKTPLYSAAAKDSMYLLGMDLVPLNVRLFLNDSNHAQGAVQVVGKFVKNAWTSVVPVNLPNDPFDLSLADTADNWTWIDLGHGKKALTHKGTMDLEYIKGTDKWVCNYDVAPPSFYHNKPVPDGMYTMPHTPQEGLFMKYLNGAISVKEDFNSYTGAGVYLGVQDLLPSKFSGTPIPIVDVNAHFEKFADGVSIDYAKGEIIIKGIGMLYFDPSDQDTNILPHRSWVAATPVTGYFVGDLSLPNIVYDRDGNGVGFRYTYNNGTWTSAVEGGSSVSGIRRMLPKAQSGRMTESDYERIRAAAGVEPVSYDQQDTSLEKTIMVESNENPEPVDNSEEYVEPIQKSDLDMSFMSCAKDLLLSSAPCVVRRLSATEFITIRPYGNEDMASITPYYMWLNQMYLFSSGDVRIKIIANKPTIVTGAIIPYDLNKESFFGIDSNYMTATVTKSADQAMAMLMSFGSYTVGLPENIFDVLLPFSSDGYGVMSRVSDSSFSAATSLKLGITPLTSDTTVTVSASGMNNFVYYYPIPPPPLKVLNPRQLERLLNTSLTPVFANSWWDWINSWLTNPFGIVMDTLGSRLTQLGVALGLLNTVVPVQSDIVVDVYVV